MRLAKIRFRATDIAPLKAFYQDLLGMRVFDASSPSALGYGSQGCLLSFRAGDYAAYEAGARDLFWKIGITLRDLDAAVDYLDSRGWPVSRPQQFRDIGYLCHLRDPEGLVIELLQQGFEGRAVAAPAGHPIGAQATLAHLTLRVTDIGRARSLCEQRHSMRLMSVQPVPEHGFTLYFYAWSDEPLPVEDLEAIENREWLWARPYALLELQHLHEGPPTAPPDPAMVGFDGWAAADDGDKLSEVGLADLAELR